MNSMFRRLIIAVLALRGLVCSACAEPFTLAQEGEPACVIVLEKDADALVIQAANDLRHYVARISGVELPLNTDGATVPGAAVYIGQCEAATETDLPPVSSNPETYAIHVREGNLYLCGRHAPATAFAVMAFIEDGLGVRWFAPRELWEYVPEGSQGDLIVEVPSQIVAPDWSCRVWSGHAWTGDWKAWLLRNKSICVPPVPFRNMQNYIHRIFAPSKYAESHPEYYPLIDGKRRIPEQDESHWRPCESNPEVVAITAEAAREYLDEHPEHNGFSLAMDDIVHMCGCDNCRAMDASPEDYGRRRFSDRHYRFVNAVAREVAKTHPDKYIGTLCYNIARNLPSTVDRLEPNVFISMTQCCAEWWRPGLKEEDMALTAEWRKRAAHMSRYDYIGLGFLTPRVYPHLMAEAMKYDRSLGFEAVYNECYAMLPTAAPMMWMVAKLQWDTDLDADALLDEFYTRMFANASAPMKAYYDLLEQSWMTPRPGRVRWGWRTLSTQTNAMAPEDVDHAERLLEQARGSADRPEILARIDDVAAALRYGAYAIRLQGASAEIAGMVIETADQARHALRRMQELALLSHEREAFWTEILDFDSLTGDSVRGLSSTKGFVPHQIREVDGGNVALAALEILHQTSPEAAYTEAAGIEAGPESALRDLVQAWCQTKQNGAPNLLKNPSFDEPGPGDGDMIADWSTWHSEAAPAQFTRVSGTGRNESPGGRITAASSACYLQSIPVNAGQRYLCTVWTRYTGQPDAKPTLHIRWRTGDGAWHPRQDLEPSVAPAARTDSWQPIGLVVSVPEDAASMVVLLGVRDQGEDSAAFFDDAGAYALTSATE